MSWVQRLPSARVLARSLGSRPDFAANVGALCRCQTGAFSGVPSGQIKEFSTSPVALCTATVTDDQGVITRNWEKVKFHLHKKYQLRPRAWLLYRDSVDRLDYLGFFKEFRMADTFFSWFLVTELHVWMLMVKLMNHGLEGSECRKDVVEAMWQDANMRKKQLGSVKESVVREHMEQLGLQFNAAVIGYDEGLLTNDKVLAGAVWRRFLQSECNDPELVEKLVIYIRKTMIMLDKIPFADLIRIRDIKWLDYKNLL
ncbi:ubiquinol-cytochrome-c reductase complex assembly factor 1 [Diachasma alloeum]|uniref:ubiquinol-cytochrome-c reductase complex assembly factor 1 n=1 Tax=Diachasma alloeum TaxID=454923 RepID=UPI00073846DB|nr:ubiquinol-cytochrome-c reductase complex assembly factor 1 [Diachasma alloeum]